MMAVTSRGLVEVMSRDQFMDAVLVRGPEATGAFGAMAYGAFGAFGAASEQERFSYYVQDRCEFGMAIEPEWDTRAGAMTMRCGSPR
jgi:hypothetical protein